LKLGPLFWHDRSRHGADLQADAAVDAGVEINPIKRCAFAIGTLAGMDAGNRAGIHAISNTFADVSDDGVGHGSTVQMRCNRRQQRSGAEPDQLAAATLAGRRFGHAALGHGLTVQFGRGALPMQPFQLLQGSVQWCARAIGNQ